MSRLPTETVAEMPKLVTHHDMQDLKKHISVAFLALTDELKSQMVNNPTKFNLPVIPVSVAAVAFSICNSIAAKILARFF